MRDLSLTSDLREGGSWTPLQRAKNDAIWTLACLALAGTRLLPLAAMRLLGRTLGAAAHLLARRQRRTALENVALAFPELGAHEQRALVRRSFSTLGELLGETVASLRPRGGPAALAVSEDARAVLAVARAEGRGVLFPSAHLGPWERVASSLVEAGIPLVTLARESYDPRFSRLPGAAARILRTLRAGRVLGVPMDLRSRVTTCAAPFLGHPAQTAVGPARIALRTRAPVVVGTAAPGEGDGWIVTATRIPTGDLGASNEDAAELTARINGELSRRIRAMPHAWVWMHDRWAA